MSEQNAAGDGGSAVHAAYRKVTAAQIKTAKRWALLIAGIIIFVVVGFAVALSAYLHKPTGVLLITMILLLCTMPFHVTALFNIRRTIRHCRQQMREGAILLDDSWVEGSKVDSAALHQLLEKMPRDERP